jgi:hypothetical protein
MSFFNACSKRDECYCDVNMEYHFKVDAQKTFNTVRTAVLTIDKMKAANIQYKQVKSWGRKQQRRLWTNLQNSNKF